MKGMFSVGAVCLGALLLALSAAWGFIFPPSNQWSPEKAAELSALSDEVHMLMFKAAEAEERPNMVKGGNPAEIQAEYREKKAKLAEMKEELESIKDSPQNSASFLRWTGIGLVVFGAIAMKVLE